MDLAQLIASILGKWIAGNILVATIFFFPPRVDRPLYVDGLRRGLL
jgi:hypothetical protein